jgi:hypothetical protein
MAETTEVSERRIKKNKGLQRGEEEEGESGGGGFSHTGLVEVLVVSRRSKIFRKEKEPPISNFPWENCGLWVKRCASPRTFCS